MIANLLAALLTAPFAFASLEDVESGPKPGDKIKPCKVVYATGESEGKEEDAAKTRKDKTTVFVFVNSERFDRPLARYLRKLDEEIDAGEKEKSAVVAVWLTNDADKSKEYLPKVQQSLKMERTVLGVFPEPNGAPEGWDINVNVRATAVVVDRGVVKASFAYESISDADVSKVAAAWRKVKKESAKPVEKPKAEKKDK